MHVTAKNTVPRRRAHVVLIVFAAGVVGFAGLEIAGQTALIRAESRAARAGIPLSIADLRARQSSRARRRNGSSEILRIAVLIRSWSDSDGAREICERLPLLNDRKALPLTMNDDAMDWIAARAFLVANESHLAALRGLPTSFGPYPISWGPSAADTLLPHLSLHSRLAKALTIAALEAAHRGDAPAAAAHFQDLLRINRVLAREVLPVGMAASAAEDEFALKVALLVISRCDFSDARLAEFQTLAGDLRKRHTLANRLGASCCVLFDGLRDQTRIAQTEGVWLYSLTPGWRKFDLAKLLRSMTEDYQRLKDHPPLEVSGASASPAAVNPRLTPLASSVGDMAWAWQDVRQVARLHAVSRSTEILIAAERFRLRNGEWPVALEEIPPVLLPPADEYDGIALFKQTEDGVEAGFRLRASEGSVALRLSKRSQAGQ